MAVTWTERVDELLYQGEEALERHEAGPNLLVVTTHRLLAFTPEGDGPNFQHVDLPNVTGVSLSATGRPKLLEYGVKTGALGLLAFGSGAAVDFAGLLSLDSVDTTGAGQVGVGGVLGMVDAVAGLLALLDVALTAGGALLTLAGLGLLAVYLRSRERELVVEVAGGDPVTVATDDPEAVRAFLRDALPRL